jgi:glucosamine--fructose-6-phosphate aminotransferase (isomerizing)
MSHQTNMRREILEISGAVETLLTRGQDAINSVASALADRNPAFMISVARGSSDHAATYFKYASELVSGLPVASVGPSVASIYGRTLKLSESACIAISQSGKSPDIVSMTEMATQQGALTFAVTNNPESDLARVSSHTLNLHAGAELSVAATKTFVTSIVSVAWLLAIWKNDDDLLAAVHRLPTVLERAALLDWSEFIVAMALRQSLYCIGRGITLAISNEAALKLKET